MAFIPYERFTIETRLPLNEAVGILAAHVEPKRIFRFPFSTNHEEFEGAVTHNSFRINRIIHYRNSFLPQVNGQLTPTPLGTRIDVTMALHPVVIAFIVIWCGIVGVATVGVIVSALNSRQFDSFMLIPPAVLLFVYLMMMGSFKWESGKTRRRLQEIFVAL